MGGVIRAFAVSVSEHLDVVSRNTKLPMSLSRLVMPQDPRCGPLRGLVMVVKLSAHGNILHQAPMTVGITLE